MSTINVNFTNTNSKPKTLDIAAALTIGAVVGLGSYAAYKYFTANTKKNPHEQVDKPKSEYFEQSTLAQTQSAIDSTIVNFNSKPDDLVDDPKLFPAQNSTTSKSSTVLKTIASPSLTGESRKAAQDNSPVAHLRVENGDDDVTEKENTLQVNDATKLDLTIPSHAKLILKFEKYVKFSEQRSKLEVNSPSTPTTEEANEVIYESLGQRIGLLKEEMISIIIKDVKTCNIDFGSKELNEKYNKDIRIITLKALPNLTFDKNSNTYHKEDPSFLTPPSKKRSFCPVTPEG